MKQIYLYDRKVPVLVVFKAGLFVVAWLFSLMFLNCTGVEASLAGLTSVNCVGTILLSVDSTVELANGEESWVLVVSMLLNEVPAIVLWTEPLSLNETGAVVSWK